MANQQKIDNKLVKTIMKNGFYCPKCNYKFTKKEIEYYISNAVDNQNCPKCNYLIT